jgi:hypothetical protein
MIPLFISVALSQEPQKFEPFPADIVVRGVPYAGILVDEVTYAELGSLRQDKIVSQSKIQTFEEWKVSQDKIFATSLNTLTAECKEQQAALSDFYDEQLKIAHRRDALQRHALPLGVAIGVIGSTLMYAGATRFYGEVLSVDTVRQ